VNRLLRALRSLFRRDRPTGGTEDRLPCAVCGEPATTWRYTVREVDGVQTIDGEMVCSRHADSTGPP
jgi:hypothetical protein